MTVRFGRILFSFSGSKRLLSLFKDPKLVKTEAFINGEWVTGRDGKTFEVTNPALFPGSSAKLADVASLSPDDCLPAIEAAKTAFSDYKRLTGRERAELLHELYNLVKKNEHDLAKLIVLENGKPYADALGEIRYSNSYFRWYAEEAARVNGHIIPSAISTNRIFLKRHPVGVCGILTPWNFPSAMIARKVGAALAVGCSTVIKPASETPLSALALAYLTDKAGFPRGVVNVVPSTQTSAIGELLCEHPDIKKVSFTGSTRVGKILMGQASSTLKKLTMELGGNAPFIVFEDADIDKAVEGAYNSKFRSSGQTCVCANRIFVHESIYDKFASKFTEKLSLTVKLGDGMIEGVTHGPLIHENAIAKVRSHIEDASSKGAEVIHGGNARPDIGQNFHELTILSNVTPDMQIFHEETFGPVAPLIKFSSDDEVISLANATDVGLAGYFYSSDVSKVFKIAEELEVGMVGVNTGAISEAAVPFGGIKESGFGREGSPYGIEDYTVIKTTVVGGLNL